LSGGEFEKRWLPHLLRGSHGSRVIVFLLGILDKACNAGNRRHCRTRQDQKQANPAKEAAIAKAYQRQAGKKKDKGDPEHLSCGHHVNLPSMPEASFQAPE